MGEPRIHKNGIVDVEFGEDVTLVEPVNLYGCSLGDGVFVGPFVEIQRRVSIGARTRVQSHAFICELVTIGEDCFISHGAMFINDPFRSPMERDHHRKPSEHRHERHHHAGQHLRRCRDWCGQRSHQRHHRFGHLCGQSGPQNVIPNQVTFSDCTNQPSNRYAKISLQLIS